MPLFFLPCFVLFLPSRVQFVKILDLKQKIYFERPKVRFTRNSQPNERFSMGEYYSWSDTVI